MKVLQINTVCGSGSIGRIAVDLLKTLEENGHESIIAYGRGNCAEKVKTIKIGSDIDNYIHVAKTRIFDKQGFASKNSTKELIKKINEYNPDIIHLHNIHGYYLNIEILFDYLKKINKPIVWTLHDCWAFTGHCAYFEYEQCHKWKSQCNNCIQKKEYPSSLLIDNSRWNFKKKKELFSGIKNMTIITPSNWLAKLVKESFLSQYEIKVINNGIDLEAFKPIESNLREKYNIEDKFIILGVASEWTRRKGFDYFLKLANKLDNKYKIIMVGINKKQEKLLGNNVIGIRRTNNVKELAEIYSLADVFVNTTLEDNFPTTNLEALACGTPVITFNTGGSVESIDEDTGIIVEKGNLDMLCDKIQEINSDFNLKCRDRAIKNYNKYDRFNDYINMYDDIIKKIQ
ncbi:glycosyltransferase [Clostridium sp.]|uniref:glycosyltransferase n=1 Tax=Clostridium sp. TaxID=1506 RepID=UPI0025E191A0|nr:glycosyltransferase [Clostridium sp.]MDY2630718.1 glycosyltransferase [Clostridium sp.]